MENVNIFYEKFSLFGKGSISQQSKKAVPSTVPAAEVDLLWVAHYIKERAREETEELRRMMSTASEPEVRDFKLLNFEAVAAAGLFSYGSAAKLERRSPFIVMDIDGLASFEEAKRVKNLLFSDQSVTSALSFISPKGRGVKWWVVVPSWLKDLPYREQYFSLCRYVGMQYGITCDSTGCNVNRLCFLPHDEEVLVNRNLDLNDVAIQANDELALLKKIAERVVDASVDIIRHPRDLALWAYAFAAHGAAGRQPFAELALGGGLDIDYIVFLYRNCLIAPWSVTPQMIEEWCAQRGIVVSDLMPRRYTATALSPASFTTTTAPAARAAYLDDPRQETIQLVDVIVRTGANITESYHDWVRVGFALAETLGAEGRECFHQLSAASAKYSYPECEKKWNDIYRANRGNVKKSTLFFLAKQQGINIQNL